MKYTLNNKTIELTDAEVEDIVRQSKGQDREAVFEQQLQTLKDKGYPQEAIRQAPQRVADQGKWEGQGNHSKNYSITLTRYANQQKLNEMKQSLL